MPNIKCNITRADGSVDVLELRNCVEVMGHDDTLPFNAQVFLNTVHVANAWNTGWGGDAEFRLLPNVPADIFSGVEEALGKITLLKAYPDSRWRLTGLFDHMAEESICRHKKLFVPKPF